MIVLLPVLMINSTGKLQAKWNKYMLLLSTRHKQSEISTTGKKKPEVVLYYNKTMSGVDCVDERVNYSTYVQQQEMARSSSVQYH